MPTSDPEPRGDHARDGSGRPRWVAGLALMVACAGAGPERGTSADPASRFAEAVEARARLRSESEWLRTEIDLTEQTSSDEAGRGLDLLRDVHATMPEEEAEIRALLGEGVRAWTTRLDGLVAEERRQVARLREELASVRAASERRQAALREVEAGGDGASVRSAWSRDDPWFWMAIAVPPVVLTAILLHDRRHALRRALRQRGLPRRTPTLLAILAIALAGSGLILAGRRPAPSGVPKPRLSTDPPGGGPEVADLVALTSARGTLGRHLEEARARRGADAEWTSARDRLMALRASLAAERDLAEALRGEADRAGRLGEELASAAEDLRSRHAVRWIIRLLAAVGVPAATIAVAGRLAAGEARRRRVERETCVRCQEVGRLQEIRLPRRGGQPEIHRLRCEATWGAMEGERCGFLFPAKLRDRAKLCLPTVGITQAGKTHWLAALSDQVRRRDDKTLRFEEVETEGLLYIRRILDQIKQGIRIGRTVDELPDPILYEFADADRPWSSEALVNLFDYAGEVAQSLTIAHPLRRRMMEADGFLAFIDPTNRADLQFDVFEGVRRDLWEAGKGALNRPVNAPAAVCVTKIDILRDQPFSARAEGAITDFYEGLRHIERRRVGAINPRLIAARSRLTARLIREIWPDVDIQDRLRGLFGRQFAFFPMTPFGLEHLGASPRGGGGPPEPFGVREPLLWLLETCGYRVFRRAPPWPVATGTNGLAHDR